MKRLKMCLINNTELYAVCNIDGKIDVFGFFVDFFNEEAIPEGLLLYDRIVEVSLKCCEVCS
jgi:hypothetical protein